MTKEEFEAYKNHQERMKLTYEELEHNCKVYRKLRDKLESEIGVLQGQVAELRRKFAVEVKAKNEAYAFIFESGLYEQFKEYSRLKVCGDNPHQACVDWLDFEAKRRAQNRNNS